MNIIDLNSPNDKGMFREGKRWMTFIVRHALAVVVTRVGMTLPPKEY
jgi:hypothetical protein